MISALLSAACLERQPPALLPLVGIPSSTPRAARPSMIWAEDKNSNEIDRLRESLPLLLRRHRESASIGWYASMGLPKNAIINP